ncbi:uncharacterized protein LOC126894571 isoform X2 [Daktulosphaira vitifoliae]|uniref:uncharacterized protein LOC126894571 isoform X2 n=1 Tax=Daktulosphaira vitifoliae TaxID=58002 RepID=UPI0021AAEF84|nr:uncharacterized protein LOC126894571 isoform X2 [Daktulosphaira vitifoliae]
MMNVFLLVFGIINMVPIILGKKITDSESLARLKVPRAKLKLKSCLSRYNIDDKVTKILGGYTIDFGEMLEEFRVRLLDRTTNKEDVNKKMGDYICKKYKKSKLDLHGGMEGCLHKVTLCSTRYQEYLTKEKIPILKKVANVFKTSGS